LVKKRDGDRKKIVIAAFAFGLIVSSVRLFHLIFSGHIGQTLSEPYIATNLGTDWYFWGGCQVTEGAAPGIVGVSG
jgi:hypothetical protein